MTPTTPLTLEELVARLRTAEDRAREAQRDLQQARDALGAYLHRTSRKGGPRLDPDSAIYAWLDETGHNAEWLAEQIGCSRSAVQFWIAGATTTRPVIYTPREVVEKVKRLSKGRITERDWPHVR